MAKVQVVDVEVLDNPSAFFSKFQFQITFDCMDNLRDDLEWKIIYVGSAESDAHDQLLDSVLVGPIPAGRHKFIFSAEPPKPELIPLQDAVGVTVVIITCTYHSHEFVRVGYYVNNEYMSTEMRENPPDTTEFSQLQRNILSSAPRVTRFKINWDDNPSNTNGAPEEEYDVQENIPPSPQAQNSNNSALGEIMQAMSDNSKDLNSGSRDSSSALSTLNNGNVTNSSNGLSSIINKQVFDASYENSIDAVEAQMLVE